MKSKDQITKYPLKVQQDILSLKIPLIKCIGIVTRKLTYDEWRREDRLFNALWFILPDSTCILPLQSHIDSLLIELELEIWPVIVDGCLSKNIIMNLYIPARAIVCM
jgi:hypothetical protein